MTQANAAFSATDQEGVWLTCLANRHYQIQTTYPYRLRNKSTKELVREYVSRGRYAKGYVCVKLDNKTYLKHRIVAIQFLPNPTNEPQVDHKNGCRTDNHISYLRWCSRSANMRNRNSIKGKPFNYVGALPSTATPLTDYNNHSIEDVFMDPSTKNLYLWNGARVRVLEPLQCIGRVCVKDVNGKCVMLDKKRLFEQEEGHEPMNEL